MILKTRFTFLNREVLSFHAAAIIMGAALFASKLFGLLRDRLLAAHFGAGDALDVYYAAFQIPDLLYTLFLVGAASAAVLPVFLEYERKGKGAAERFIGNLLVIFSAIAVVGILVAILLAPWLMTLVAPGFSLAKLAIAIQLTRRMLFGTLFFGIAGILSSVLQARRRFFAFALPPIVYNVGIIIGIVLLVPAFGVIGLSYGVLLGAILQVVVLVPTILLVGFRIRPSFSFSDPGLRRVLTTSLPRVAALGMSQLTITALAAIASLFAPGSVAVFKLAANLLYVPVGLIGVSYALAMFPKLSGASLDGQGEVFRKHVLLGMRTILFWTLPIVAVTIVLRAHLVRVILGAGAFNWMNTRLVAATLAVLAVAILSESLLPLVIRAFYALGDTTSPLVWDVVGSLATFAFSIFFAVWFAHSPAILAFLANLFRIGDLASPKILAVALGFTLGSLVNILLLFFALRRVTARRFDVALGFGAGEIATMAAAALLAGVAAYLVLLPFPALIPTNTFLGILAQGLSAGIVGFAVYGFLLAMRGNEEIMAIIQVFRKRLLTLGRTPQVYETEKLDGEGGK